jgi:hypothetical protein
MIINANHDDDPLCEYRIGLRLKRLATLSARSALSAVVGVAVGQLSWSIMTA